MSNAQHRNVEQAIDDLCENLAWSWGYFRSLKGMYKVSSSSPDSFTPYPQFVSCLYNGLFDILFVKIYNFIDSSRGARGFPRLFKLLRRYYSGDKELMAKVKSDEARLKNEVDIEKVKRWRNEVSAHLTQSYRDSAFFSSNRLHISEVEEVLNLIEGTVENYSLKLLNRNNDIRNPSKNIVKEIGKLFSPINH